VLPSFLLQKQEMNIDDIIPRENFPHATLHDAEIERVTLDYVTRQAIFECSLYVGDPDSDEEAREAQKAGRFVFTDFLYCVIEPPYAAYPYQRAGAIRIPGDGPVDGDKIPGQHLPGNLPEGAFAHGFFVNDWNAFIYIAAQKVRFEWTDA
jgi:hypothetical protein